MARSKFEVADIKRGWGDEFFTKCHVVEKSVKHSRPWPYVAQGIWAVMWRHARNVAKYASAITAAATVIAPNASRRTVNSD